MTHEQQMALIEEARSAPALGNKIGTSGSEQHSAYGMLLER